MGTWLLLLLCLHLSFCLIRRARHCVRLIRRSCKMWRRETWGCPISIFLSLLRLIDATLLLLMKVIRLLCPWTGSSLWTLRRQCYRVNLRLFSVASKKKIFLTGQCPAERTRKKGWILDHTWPRFFFLWRWGPTRAMASWILRFLVHTQWAG